MILIIAEKHTVGTALARAILTQDGVRHSKFHITGTLEAIDPAKICIAWFNGHIAELKAPHEYHSTWKSWNIDRLPISPPGMEFQYNLTNKGVFDNLVRLLKQSPLELVNACDAGREGELIFREALELLRGQTEIPETISRMWINSTTPSGLKEAWGNRKNADQAKYNNLAEAAYRRTYADWLLGMNMTRYATAAIEFHNETVHVGRVKTPVLGLISYREYEIESFKRQSYYRVPITFETGRRHYDGLVIAPEDKVFGNTPTSFRELKDARYYNRQVLSGLSHWNHIDVSEPKNLNPPKPFDLLDLQRSCFRIFRWSGDYTLKLAQSAYLEEQTITYPRTESHSIPIEMEDYATNLHEKIWCNWLVPQFEALDELHPKELNTYHFKKKPTSDHHGILPTMNRPASHDANGRTRDAYLLWELITKRFILSMLPRLEMSAVRRMLFHPDDEEMRAVCIGETITDAGWMAVDDIIGNTRGYGITLKALRARELPPLEGETSRRIRCEVRTGLTDPPFRYDDDTLLEAMRRMKLGTAATRSDIVLNLIENNYIERSERGTFDPTPFGKMVTLELQKRGAADFVSARTTTYWEDQLDKVEKGKPPQTRENFLKSVIGKSEEIGRTINGLPATEIEVLCPITGEPIEEDLEGFVFPGFPDMLFPRRFRGRSITTAEYRDIIIGKRKGALLEFISKKSDRSYKARVIFQPRKHDLIFKPALRGKK